METRRVWLFGLTILLWSLSGCCSWDELAVRSQSPEEELTPEMAERQRAELVGDLAVPYNMAPTQVEAVGLVVGLNGTGSDPPPSPQRAVLLSEMQTREVESPNRVLQSTSTALVLVRGFLKPGIQEGDRFDIEVRVPSRSETTSLRGGRLLETRLTELRVMGGQIHEGHLLALAKGPIMIDPAAGGEADKILACRGRILGGGVALKSRPLGLRLRDGHQSVFASSRVASAVNRRFHTFDRGLKVGVASAQTDKSIRLLVHPRYKDNIQRYVRIIRAVALRESTKERAERIAKLKRQLLDPATTAGAALQLEAIGRDGVEALLEGIRSRNGEVRFYAAEALAYLDRREAAEPLAEAARTEPAFRVFALSALAVMEDFSAHDALRELLAQPSAETRYGAFRALWTMNPDDPLIRGENLGDRFSYHVLATDGPPLIHVTRSHRPELILFGPEQRVKTPLAINAGNEIMVTATDDSQLSVARFSPGQIDQKRVVAPTVDAMVRAIVELGGTYPDVVQALQEAQALRALPGRFEVDALPEAGRSYRRVAEGERSSARDSGGANADSPLDGADSALDAGTLVRENKRRRAESSSSTNPFRAFVARMMGKSPQ